MRSDPLDYGKGASLIGDKEREAVDRVMRSRSLFRYYGPDLQGTVAAFEASVCQTLGVSYAVAVSSGTAALRCALAALGVGPGQRVVVPAFTFIATVNAVVAAGATPVFAEVDDTLGLDPAKVPDADAAIVVHVENVVCDMDALRLAMPVIEDAAQAFGATYNGRAAGGFGALGCFSLQLEKNITAGEGGVVTTNDERLYLRASRYQDQGGQFVTSYASSRGDDLSEPFAAENLRMGELAGAVAGVQLGRLPRILESLRANKRRILDGVGEIDGLTPRRVPDPLGDGSSSCLWFAPDQAMARALVKRLLAERIPCAQMYGGRPVYLNQQVLDRRTATGTGDWVAEKGMFPVTEALVARNVIVPVGVRYTEAQCDEIATAIRKVAAEVFGMKIGVGAAVITPASMPVHLAGFGEPQVAHEVRDDLEVRAVYVANDDVAVCLLVCDLLGMSHHFADPVRAAVGNALGLERAAVLTSCVHTHAGPSTMAGTDALGWPTPAGYADLLTARCVEAARDAKHAATTATLRFGRWSLPAGLSINRRGHPYDPWFTALDVHGDGGRIATIANLSIHPVALGPECLAVSSDWVGAFRSALEARVGGRTVMLQGTSGDVNPHHVHRQGNDCRDDLFAEADELGANLAEAVDAVLGTAEDVPGDGPAIERHRTFEAKAGDTALGRQLEKPVPVELVEWSLGPVRVVSVPGEGFHALGRTIESRAGGKVLLAGLAPIWQGYLPMPFTEGYEEETSYGREFVSAVNAALT